MIKRIVTAFFFIFFVATFSFFNFLEIKTNTVSADFDCLQLNSGSSQSDKDHCKNELNQIEKDLADLIEKQKEQQKTTGTIKGDVDYLTSQINALKTKIKARAYAIAQLKVNINDKVNKIESLSVKINREHKSLGKLLRNTNEFDNSNVMHIMLSDQSISDFYNDVESYTSINEGIADSIGIIRVAKKQTEIAKIELEMKQDAENDAKAELENAEQVVSKSEADKKTLLALSKDKEAGYKKLATEKKLKADKIRAALFSLAGTSQKIDFGTALQYANEVSKTTSIDPAFLLAVITQESNLGANVGQCYLTDTATGAGVGKNTGTVFQKVMKPMGLSGRRGDIEDFLRITESLGRVWNTTPVSCPIAGVAGYGGAMGPAQFIPSTWGGYESRLKDILGHYADPWNPRDAFFASATLLTDKGAVGNSASAQNRAACSYYGTGGASCSYSKSVMKLKATIQANIDLLN